MAKQFLGQHFLHDPAAVRAIVRAIAPARGDLIVEIGPGHGELTLPLAEACAESGSELVCVEKDGRLAAQLEERLHSSRTAGTIRVVTGDALAFLKSGVPQRGTVKIAGNIPYYLTGRLLRSIGEREQPPARCVFMVQKEVAERIEAQPPRMNRLAASVQFWSDPKVAATVPRERFRPAPEVDSAVIVLDAVRRGPEPDAAAYYAAVRALFSQPRKTVLNNLAAHAGRMTKEDAAGMLRAAGVAPAARPQDLSVRDIARIAIAAKAAGIDMLQ